MRRHHMKVARMASLRLSMVAMVAILFVCKSASAGFIIQNNSFESPDTTSFNILTPTGWAWNNVGVSSRGVVLEGVADFPTSTGGDQWGFLNSGAALSQLIGLGMLQPNTVYEFSFFQFHQTNIAFLGGSGLQFEIWDSDPFSGAGSALDSVAFAATGVGVIA